MLVPRQAIWHLRQTAARDWIFAANRVPRWSFWRQARSMMLRKRIRLIEGLLVALAVLAFTHPAQAHPHVWVTVESTLLYEHGAFVGLKHKWTFDEFYSAMAVEGLDTN